jgi:hypothetical protein
MDPGVIRFAGLRERETVPSEQAESYARLRLPVSRMAATEVTSTGVTG